MKQSPSALIANLLKEHGGDIVTNAVLLRQDFFNKYAADKKDIDKECGYPSPIDIAQYKSIYDREGIGTRIVDIFPDESWKTDPEVLENPDGDFTEWEQAWKDVVEEHNVYDVLNVVDRISGIGSFGLLFIGIDDGERDLSKPVEGIDLRTGKPTNESTTANRKILFLRTFDESVITIDSYENDVTSPRYGMPNIYKIQMAQDLTNIGGRRSSGASSMDSESLTLHWTRCIHVADNRRNSAIFGTPRMQEVFNRLYDLRKVLGGAAEMFWKGGFPGIAFESHPDAAPLTTKEKKGIKIEFERYMNGLQRYLALSGMTAKSLSPQIADPSNVFDTAIKAICASKGIPYRIFIGTEEAQLAGAQDKKAWNERIAKRRDKYLGPRLIRPFIDRLIGLGVLPSTQKYSIVWEDLSTPTQLEKATIAKAFTEALAKYLAGGVDSLIQPLEFLTEIVGMPTEKAQAILENSLLAIDGTVAEAERIVSERDAKAQAAEDRLREAQQAQQQPGQNRPLRNSFWEDLDTTEEEEEVIVNLLNTFSHRRKKKTRKAA